MNVYGPNANYNAAPTYTFNNPQSIQFLITGAGVWTFMINHTLNSTTTVNNFHLNFYTFSDNKCMSTYSTFQYYDSNYLNIPS